MSVYMLANFANDVLMNLSQDAKSTVGNECMLRCEWTCHAPTVSRLKPHHAEIENLRKNRDDDNA